MVNTIEAGKQQICSKVVYFRIWMRIPNLLLTTVPIARVSSIFIACSAGCLLIPHVIKESKYHKAGSNGA